MGKVAKMVYLQPRVASRLEEMSKEYRYSQSFIIERCLKIVFRRPTLKELLLEDELPKTY